MGLTEFLAQHITHFIDKVGYPSVFILMVMESMVFPVPSEAVMPFAGFLIVEKSFTFTGVIFYSTLGSIVGSLLSYWIGQYGGKPFISKYGKYHLLDHEDLEKTEKFFGKYGDATIFVSRFIPVIRHLISIPAGFAKMSIFKFSFYTILGAGMWNAFLALAGFHLKQNWEKVMKYNEIFDILVVLAIGVGIYIFVKKHLNRKRA
jgi:membrane protein DedA with SNARE-associated domain